MKPAIRPSTPDDGPAIVALLREAALRPESYAVEPGHLYWQYWQERADWAAPRSFVLAQGREIVGHAGIVPGICQWGARRLKTIHVIDWAARHGTMGAGRMLMKYVSRRADLLLAIGGSEQTLAILPTLGFRSHGAATPYVRTLRPLRRLRDNASPAWQFLPRSARSMYWAMTARTRAGAALETRRITPDELRDIPLPRPKPNLAVFERSAASFRYALACPIVPMAMYVVQGAGRLRGYFLLAFVPGQARIVDCWVDSDEPADWRALVQSAVDVAKENPDIAEIVAIASDPMLSASLIDSGFHARVKLEIRLLLVGGGTELPDTTLRVQMLENDSAYLHYGSTEYWW